MRKLSIIVVALILVIGMVIPTGIVYAEISVPDATSEFYVNDFAGVFSPEEKAKLIDNALNLADTYDSIQVVLATVESLNGNYIQDYAVSMTDQYKIGKNGMGVLILFSADNQQIFVNTHSETETTYFTNTQARKLINDCITSNHTENQFSTELINLQEAIISEIKSQISEDTSFDRNIIESQDSSFPVDSHPTTGVNNLVSSIQSKIFSLFNKTVFFIILLSLLGIVIIAIIILIIKKKHLKVKLSLTEEKLEALNSQYESAMQRMEVKKAAALESKQSEIQKLQSQNGSLNSDLKNLQSKLSSLNQAYSSLQEYCNRAKKIHPKLDNEISALIARELKEHDTSKSATNLFKPFKGSIKSFHFFKSSEKSNH